jgi:hypothetical protein
MRIERIYQTEEIAAALQLEKVAEPRNIFISNLYRRGITHVGYGEDHGSTYLHKSVNSLIPVLKQKGVDVICLELNYQMQKYIDKFQDTGDESYLFEVINGEVEHLRKGLPVEGRVQTTDYFDIIRNATKLGIKVVAMDDVFLKKISERDQLMANNIPNDKRVFAYAGQVHLSGKFVHYGGVPKFLLESGVDMYTVRQIYKSHGSDLDLKRHAFSKRFVKVVKNSSLLLKMGSFGFDTRFNPETTSTIRNLFPSRNPEYFGEGFIFNSDIE